MRLRHVRVPRVAKRPYYGGMLVSLARRGTGRRQLRGDFGRVFFGLCCLLGASSMTSQHSTGGITLVFTLCCLKSYSVSASFSVSVISRNLLFFLAYLCLYRAFLSYCSYAVYFSIPPLVGIPFARSFFPSLSFLPQSSTWSSIPRSRWCSFTKNLYRSCFNGTRKKKRCSFLILSFSTILVFSSSQSSCGPARDPLLFLLVASSRSLLLPGRADWHTLHLCLLLGLLLLGVGDGGGLVGDGTVVIRGVVYVSVLHVPPVQEWL